MSQATLFEAKTHLSALINRVEHDGETVIITRHGKPVAVLVSKDLMRKRRTARAFADAARIHQLIEDAGKRPWSELGSIDSDFAEEMIAEIRANRDAEG